MLFARRALTRPLTFVGAVCLWSAWNLRATLSSVAYLDDASVHEQMVRFAGRRLSQGHLPLNSWFPFLNLGSPQFLHYQSLGAMITGAAGLVVGSQVAFRWTLFLLLSLWPLVVYASGRIFGFGRGTSAAAAVLAPFLMSAPGVGYEQPAYVWIGYGLWTQLWASWTLPLAWATTWRSLSDRRFVAPASVCIAATMAFHFETGYLALAPLVIFPFAIPSRLLWRAARAAAVGLGALGMAAWVLVPLLAQARWAAVNTALAATPLVRGYGARQDLTWLVTGQIFDHGRLPVITIALGVGFLLCVRRWKEEHVADRAIVLLFVFSLLFSFGPSMWRVLVDVVPGHGDIFFRRFMMGVQLAGLYIAGVGVAGVFRLLRTTETRLHHEDPASPLWGGRWVTIFALLLSIGALVPAVSQLQSYDALNAKAIAVQLSGQAKDGALLDPLLAFIRTHGQGRVYAGEPNNWGADFNVGSVPVFKYLENEDIDEVGYTLRTASLMSQPEYEFDQGVSGDYVLFGIRYLILPRGMQSPVAAARVMVRGPYALWVLPHNSYVDVVDTVGTIRETRTDVGPVSLLLLASPFLSQHRDLTVSWPDSSPAPPTTTRHEEPTAPGLVLAQRDDLADGFVRVKVDMDRRAVVLLSVSYDPGWTATVDSVARTPEMLAPAVVGVPVGAGTHEVVFQYVGYHHYSFLALVAAVAFALSVIVSLWPKRRRRSFETSVLRPTHDK
jgi:hypothetical protein